MVILGCLLVGLYNIHPYYGSTIHDNDCSPCNCMALGCFMAGCYDFNFRGFFSRHDIGVQKFDFQDWLQKPAKSRIGGNPLGQYAYRLLQAILVSAELILVLMGCSCSALSGPSTVYELC